MKFLDANGLALFTKRIFSKFVSNITGADNKITITKGDGTTNEINLNEVVKTDVIGEDPPDDDNSNKIPSTRWVQKFVATMVFKLISKLAGTEETGISSSGSFLGVNWLIAQNGYICFGKLFGGLILQWGFSAITTQVKTTINFPIAFNTSCYSVFATHSDGPSMDMGVNSPLIINGQSFMYGANKKSFEIFDTSSPSNTQNFIFYACFGK